MKTSPFNWQVFRHGTPFDVSRLRNFDFTHNRDVPLSWYGKFPEIRGSVIINGGIPQKADFALTKANLAATVNEWGGDTSFDGYITLDFEAWFPQWERISDAYKNLSIAVVRAAHPTMSEAEMEKQAQQDFEKAGITYFLSVLKMVKELRPKAKVAYYDLMMRGYNRPYYDPKYAKDLQHTNDKVLDIHRASDMVLVDIYQFYPSVGNGTPLPDGAYYWGAGRHAPTAQPQGEAWYEDNRAYVEGNVKEGLRLAEVAGKKPVFAYAWARYHESAAPAYRWKFNRSKDMWLQLIYPLTLGAKGVFLWGDEWQAYDNILGSMQPYIDSVIAPMTNDYMADS